MSKVNFSKINSLSYKCNKSLNVKKDLKTNKTDQAELSSLDAMANYNKGAINLSFMGKGDKAGESSIEAQENLKNIVKEKLTNNKILDDLDDSEIETCISDTIDVINYISEKEDVFLSKEDVIEIMDAGQLWKVPSLAVTSLTGMSDTQYAGKAYVLAKLVNNGKVSMSTLKNTTQAFSKEGAFCATFNKNIANASNRDYFKEVLTQSGFGEKEINFAESIAESVSFGDMLTDSLDVVNWEDLSLNNDAISSLIDMGAPLELILKYQDKLDYEKFLNEVTNDYKVEIKEIQNGDEAKLVATKTITFVDDLENKTSKDCINISKVITMDIDGKIKKSTTYTDDNNKSKAHYFGSNKSFVLDTKNIEVKTEDGVANISVPVSQIEIVNDSNGEPSYILHTKESENLSGAYETIKYSLKDYPEDMNVISSITDGTIIGGEKLSSVSINNGETTYEQNLEQNDNNIKRNYSKQVDKNGDLVSINYQYNIANKDGKKLLSLDRKWNKNPDGTTNTTINGKNYVASFDDDTKTIAIVTEEGEEISYSLNDKFTKKISSEYLETRSLSEKVNKEDYMIFENSVEERENFWQMCKTMPADQLINLGKNIKKITVKNNLTECNIDQNRHLNAIPDVSVVSHEIGHSIDSENDFLGKISQNKELIDVYNKEMKAFSDEYPELAQNIVSYFTQTGGGGIFSEKNNTGLSEFVAEANTLLTTYGNNADMINARADYLVRYFPETVAKIGELLGY